MPASGTSWETTRPALARLALLSAVQALEAVKLLSGVGDPLSRRLLVVDCAAGRFHSVKLRAK